VKNGDCVIFFIRKKDAPEKSYVTAECRKNGLGQCFLSNNRVLNNDEVIDFAKNICKKIITGCRSGKIHALENVESD
jgi:hypothetical protein